MITVAQLVARLTLPKPVRPESSRSYAPTNGLLKPDIAFLNRFVPISVYDMNGQFAPRRAAQPKVPSYFQPRRVPTAILFVVSEIQGPTPVARAKVGTKRKFDKGPGASTHTHTPTLPRAEPGRTFGFSRKLSFSSPWKRIPEARYELREERPSGSMTSFDDSKRAKSEASRVTARRNELDWEDREVDKKQWSQGVKDYEKEEEGDHVTMGNGKGRANGERPWD